MTDWRCDCRSCKAARARMEEVYGSDDYWKARRALERRRLIDLDYASSSVPDTFPAEWCET